MSVEIRLHNSKSPTPAEEKYLESFDLTYYGSLKIDRRYIPVIFHWLALKVIRTSKSRKVAKACIYGSSLKITDRHNPSTTFQEHSFESIYRLSRLHHIAQDNFLAYITIGNLDSSICMFYVFECKDNEVKAEFLKSLKTRVLGFQKLSTPPVDQKTLNIVLPKPTHRRGVSSGAILVSPVLNDTVFRDSVYYIGKVTISHPQAPAKFIDDVLIQLKKMHVSELTLRGKHTGSVTMLGQKRLSMDDNIMFSGVKSKVKESVTINSDKTPAINTRQRSVSVDSDNRDFDSNEECKKEEVKEEEAITLSNIQEEVQSRLVTLQISKSSLMLFSIGLKTLLLEKKIKNISFCTKGDARNDHFGFICRENGNHICYIFQGESEHKVDAILKAMKQAFAEALEASAHLTLCDTCPLQYFNKLCTKLESASTITEKNACLRESLEYLSEYDALHVANKISEEESFSDLEEIEISVNILREYFDQKQMSHKHAVKKEQINITTDEYRDRSKSSTIFEKAKKSLTSSFPSLAIKKPNGQVKSPNISRIQSSEAMNKSRSRSFYASSISCPTTPDLSCHKTEFAFEHEQRNSRSGKFEDGEKNVPKVLERKEDGVEENDELSDMSNIKNMQKKNRKESWRQAIYHSVVTPSRRSSASSIGTLPGDNEERQEKENVNPRVRAGERWKNAIMNQILLIRMEKENKKLAANISATETRRQKLSYMELGSYSAESAIAWDEMLSRKNDEKVDDHALLEAVRGGVPRARRGDVWQFLIKQYAIRIPERSEEQFWKEESYKKLLRKNTTHQHAILIDLGRTFPKHEHFIPRLGSGQLSLFNILKSYSLLDKEVGYCQGLSFVAGLLLMHMSEEEAFKSFCHVMFDLQIRNQYKPDMNAVQQQLYQLSRLLHDYHPTLYEHLNANDVTPTLYAAPWFLTLYASQYPVGFVARAMDLIFLQGLDVIFKIALVLVGNHVDEILNCDSFESIVDYMKLTLPEKVTNETDEIMSRALNMDIKQQLNLYEVEYQLLKEEMIDIRQNKEKLEKQEEKHKELENQVVELRNELEDAKELINMLKLKLDQADLQKKDDQATIDRLRFEKDMLPLSLNESNSICSPRSEEVKRIMSRHLNFVDGSEKSWELVLSPDSVDTEMNRIIVRDQNIDGTVSPSDVSEISNELNKNGECVSVSSESNGDAEDRVSFSYEFDKSSGCVSLSNELTMDVEDTTSLVSASSKESQEQPN